MWRSILLLGAAILAGAILAGSGTAALAADPEFQRLGKDGDFSLTPPEVSDGPEAGWYLRTDAGYVVPQMGAVSAGPFPLPTMSDLDSGWSVGAGVGYRFAGPFRAETSIDYLSFGSAETAAGPLGLDATVALASLYWDMINFAGVTPYVGGGLGFAIVSYDTPTILAGKGNDWGFAFTLAAGLSYAITSQWSIDIGYRYLDLGPRTAAAPSGLAALEVENLAAHQVRVGVRYQVP